MPHRKRAAAHDGPLRARAALLLLLAQLAGCRDGVTPFAPPEREVPATGPRQLTFGTGLDTGPAWSGSDTLVFRTSSWPLLPSSGGALLQIDAARGTAAPLMADVQRTGAKLLGAPVPSPDGRRIAYIDVVRRDAPVPCSIPEPRPPDSLVCPYTQPLLDSAVLRVRRVDETRPFDQDPAIGIDLQGPDAAPVGVVFTQRAFPFQRAWRDEGVLLLRPTWSRDGARIIFGDGLRLYVWTVGAGAATPLPNTADALMPAWSPAGDRIAFVQWSRTDSITVTCGCNSTAVHRRVLYEGTPRIIVQNLDGTGRGDLGAGEDPAWTPDGAALYVRRDFRIVRLDPVSGSASPVDGTDFSRMPAVSPDGARLAFARTKLLQPVNFRTVFDWDLWVVPLR